MQRHRQTHVDAAVPHRVEAQRITWGWTPEGGAYGPIVTEPGRPLALWETEA